MAGYKTDALVLKKRKLGEADNVLILASPVEGRIDAIARGVRKTTSRFGARLEPMSYVRLVLGKGRTFDSVTSAQVLDAHDALRGDSERVAFAAPVLDILDKILVRGQGEPVLVALGDATLSAMERDDANLSGLVLGFAVKAMAMLGVKPSVDECICCAEDPGDTGYFSSESGGAVCVSCAQATADAVPCSRAAREIISQMLGARMPEIAAMTLEPATEAELFGLVRGFLMAHVHGRLKSLEYLARCATAS